MTCIKCNTSITANFCGQCGRPAQLARVDWHYIVHEIQHVLHFEKGIFYTVKALLHKPGTSIHSFITADRSRLVKPVLFIVVTSLIYSTINHLFHIEQEYIHYDGTSTSAVGVISAWIQSHYGYANIIMGIFIAYWLKIFYKTYRYNFFEILILLCFVMGMGMLILSVFALLQGLTGLQTMGVAAVAMLLYSSWAIGHFFDGKRVASYFKALVSYVLGMVSFSTSVMVTGVLIDLVLKH